MPRFSANLGFLWPDRPLLHRIEAAAHAGFRAIEMHWPYDTPAKDVRAAAQRFGLATLGINTVRGDLTRGEFGLAALPGREKDFEASFDQAVAYCIEAGFVAIHAMAGIVPPHQRAEAERTFRANIARAAEKAAAHKLTVLLEPINPRDAPNYFYSTQEEAAAIITELGLPNVRLMFDCYHVGVAQGDILRRLAKVFPHVGHVQIAAVPSRAEPDEGEIAYGAIFAELDRLGWQGWVGCEYKPRGQTDQGLAWVHRLGVVL
ncbi:MAG TPA: TIM barrel protein [Bauldia sp.]|nr:TIM barrel protein [Bauldia sp.]